jgi:hypothetical protein
MCTATLTSTTVTNIPSGRAVLVVQTCDNPKKRDPPYVGVVAEVEISNA